MPVFAAVRKSPRIFAAAGLALSLALSACSPSGLDKKDSDAFLETVKQNASAANLILNYDKSETDGYSITLTNVGLTSETINGQTVANYADSPSVILLGTVRFDGVAPEKNGVFSVKEMTAGLATKEDPKQKSDEILVHGFKLAPAYFAPQHINITNIANISSQIHPYKLNIQNVAAISDSKNLADVDNISIDFNVSENHIYQYKINLGSIISHLSAFPAEKVAGARKQLADLGLTDNDITMRYSTAGQWNRKTGIANFTNDFSFDKLGGYSFSAELSGLSQPFVENLKTMIVTAAADQKKTPPDYSATLIQAGNLLNFVRLDKAEFVYHDDSMTGRILDSAAKDSGQTRAEFVEQLKSSLNDFVQKIVKSSAGGDADSKNFAAFIARSADQIDVFLDNPHSLRLTANPPTPLSWISLFLAGRVIYDNPAVSVRLLNPQLDANIQPQQK